MFTSRLSCHVSPCKIGLIQAGKEDTFQQSSQGSVINKRLPVPRPENLCALTNYAGLYPVT